MSFIEQTVRETVLAAAGIDLSSTRTVEAFKANIQNKTSVHLSSNDTWSDMFFKVMLDVVEPSLDPKQPTILRDYPLPISALATTDETSWTAQKFELYWYGLEICNGCTELTDLAEMKKRYENESVQRKLRGKFPHPYPLDLQKALETLPPCAGVALGLERLFLCLMKLRA